MGLRRGSGGAAAVSAGIGQEVGGGWGDTLPAFLARDTASPYVDNWSLQVAGKPEVREYRALYTVGYAEIGNPSDESFITATP